MSRSAERGREIEADEYPALAEWLDRALIGVAIEPVEDGAVTVRWDVIVHNGLLGDDREEAILATCENEQEAELMACGLWALFSARRTLATWIAGQSDEA